MSEDQLSRLYPRLSGGERFELWMLANARSDTADAERLFASCPQHEYKAADRAFRERLRAARDLVAALMGDANQAFGFLDGLALASHCVTPMLVWSPERARLPGSGPDRSDQAHATNEAPEDTAAAAETVDSSDDQPAWTRSLEDSVRYPTATMELLHRIEIATLAALWDAFAAVCREELALEPETVVGALWPDLLARFERVRPELDGRQPLAAKYDPYQERRATFQAAATEFWRQNNGAA